MSRSNIDIYKTLTKEELIDLLRLYGRLALTIDGLWFLALERIKGTDEAIRIDEEVWGQYGKWKGNLLKRFLSVTEVNSLEDICRCYLLTPIFANLGGQAEIRGDKCYLRVTECYPQKARISKGLGEFACKGVGMAYFGALLTALNPDIRFRCVVCPPDEHSKEVWCEWEVWIERNSG